MNTWKPKGGFPFGVLRTAGFFLIVLGLTLVGLGTANIVYSVKIYLTKYDCDPVERMAELVTTRDPCDDDDLMIYTWVASPVWTGVMVMITGIVGAALTRNTDNLQKHRDAYGALSGVSACVFCVLTIVLCALDIDAGKGVFIDTSNKLKVRDTVKFVLPLISILIAFLAIIVCLIVVFHVCMCADLYRDDDYRGKKYTYREKKRKRGRKPPGIRGSAEYADKIRSPQSYAYNNPAYSHAYHAGSSDPNLNYAAYRPQFMQPYSPYYSQSENGNNHQFHYQNYSSLPNNPTQSQIQQLRRQAKPQQQGREYVPQQQFRAPMGRPAPNGNIPNGGAQGRYPTMPQPTIPTPVPNGSLLQGSGVSNYPRSNIRKQHTTNLTDIDETIDQMFDFTEEMGDSDQDSGWEGGGSSNRRMVIDI